MFPNDHVETMKGPIWVDVMNLLAKNGDRIMIDMIIDCAVFVPLSGAPGNFYQLSGESIWMYLIGHFNMPRHTDFRINSTTTSITSRVSDAEALHWYGDCSYTEDIYTSYSCKHPLRKKPYVLCESSSQC